MTIQFNGKTIQIPAALSKLTQREFIVISALETPNISDDIPLES